MSPRHPPALRSLAKAAGCVVAICAMAGCVGRGIDCQRSSVGFTPLSDLRGTYKGQPGGLYPDGENVAPSKHLADGLAIARDIRPLDAEGRPSPDGTLVFISIGMSNTTQEFSAFKSLADTDPQKNPRVVIVDGAQNGFSARHWWARSSCSCWRTLDRRLAASGVTPLQVAAAWINVTNENPTLPFPAFAETLRDDIVEVVENAKTRYPNLRLAYLSSRTYAGYATTMLNPEPYAYESAFAVRGVIDEQLHEQLSFEDDADGRARAPWLAWGPYLWADGIRARGDGATWTCGDFASDGTHPSESGRLKVANALLSFVKSDPTARIWFTR